MGDSMDGGAAAVCSESVRRAAVGQGALRWGRGPAAWPGPAALPTNRRQGLPLTLIRVSHTTTPLAVVVWRTLFR